MISDTEIMLQIAAKTTIGWANLYDKYAATMYGFILKITDIPAIADQILLQSFVELKLDSSSLKTNKSLCIGLLVHTHTNALLFLKMSNLLPKTGHTLLELLKTFCTDETKKNK